DARRVLQYVNGRWLRLFGMTMEEAKSSAWQEMIHPDDLPRLMTAWDEATRTKTELRCQHRVRGIDGSYRWVLSRAHPDTGPDDGSVRWIGLTVDIADQKRAEAELEERVRERTEQLEEANREMEGFTYTVSHDLRGPLRAIMSTSMILKEDFGQILPIEAQDQLERQARAAKKMGDLIDDLLRLSRISRQEISRQRLDVSALAAEIVTELGSPVDCKIQPEMSAEADPKLIRLALQNLLDNAIKFSDAQRPVEVGKLEDGPFFVRDQGIGFDMQYAHKLFMPFERLVLDSQYPGTGIGLANVRRIVERHGGKVWAESELGRGATFYLTLA
ncbi:MAG: hypothetical protein QOJ65_2585, partial [Fimbriimonadaceae bacterium]|nr:hypothetical protein [Fimbriimonadaceae bacterium]